MNIQIIEILLFMCKKICDWVIKWLQTSAMFTKRWWVMIITLWIMIELNRENERKWKLSKYYTLSIKTLNSNRLTCLTISTWHDIMKHIQIHKTYSNSLKYTQIHEIYSSSLKHIQIHETYSNAWNILKFTKHIQICEIYSNSWNLNVQSLLIN